MAQGILRPLSYGDIFDETFDLYKKNFVLFAGISAVVQIPVYAIIYGIRGNVASVVVSILSMIATYFVLAATTYAISQVYLGNQVTIAESYKTVSRSVWPLFCNMFVAGLHILIGLILLIVPGVILSLRYSFVAQVYILEGLGGGDGRARSTYLAKENMGRIFIVGLLMGILVMIITGILSAPIVALIPAMTSHPQEVGGALSFTYGVYEGVVRAIVGPLGTIAMVLLYYDLRVRKEGFDIQMLAKQMGMALPAAPAAPQAPKPTDLNGSI